MPTDTLGPLLVHVQVAAVALFAALGPTRQPATLTFTAGGLTVTTPSGRHHVTARVVARHAPGIHTAGLRPADADRLRATCGTDTAADLYVHAFTVTLIGAAGSVTVGRR
jgi:hypothetical protein